MRSVFLSMLATVSLTVSVLVQAASPDDIMGYWRTIDDKTGFSLTVVKIEKAKNGTYLGSVVELIPRAGYVPFEVCQNCPAPFTGRKVTQMPMLWNLKADSSEELRYTDGYVIDPHVGKIYALDVKLSASGRQLTLRGNVIGAGFIGRTQSWLRDASYKPK